LLKDGREDVVAYFNVNKNPQGEVSIQADLSGRHHNEGENVLKLLTTLEHRLGGVVTDDDDNII